MGQVDITWVQNFQFVAVDSSKHSVVLSGTRPEDGIGMKPAEMLLVSLGSCTAYDVVHILNKKRQKLTGLHVTVTSEQAPDFPKAFVKFHVHYEVTGRSLKPDAVEQAITLSKEKYCSVSATLSQAAEITYDYTIIDENAG